MRTQRFEIRTRIPEGAPAYTFDQFMRGDASGLEKMLQSLLAEHFKLVVHTETRQVAGYALVLGKGGSKLTHSTAEEKRGLGVRREVGPNGQISNTMVGRKVEMRDFAFLLLLTTQRPVIDRTGLTGEFNFNLEFAPFDSDGTDSNAPSLFTEIQRLGPRKLHCMALDVRSVDSYTIKHFCERMVYALHHEAAGAPACRR